MRRKINWHNWNDEKLAQMLELTDKNIKSKYNRIPYVQIGTDSIKKTQIKDLVI